VGRRFIPMEINGPIFAVRGPTRRVTAATAAVRARAEPGCRRRGRFDTGDDRTGAALQDAVGARDEARQLVLPNHAQPVDRHGAGAIAKNCERSAGRGRAQRRRGPASRYRGRGRPASSDGRDDAVARRAARGRRADPVEGFGYREVSEMLGLPIGTVSSRLVRGRTALLALVGEA